MFRDHGDLCRTEREKQTHQKAERRRLVKKGPGVRRQDEGNDRIFSLLL